MRKILCSLALVTMAAVSSQAATLVGCPTTVGGLKSMTLAGNACQDEDKIYSNFSGTLSDTWFASVSTIVFPTYDQHTVIYNSSTGTELSTGTYTFQYTVTVDPTVLNRLITSIGVSANISQATGSLVQKDVYTGGFTTLVGSASTVNGARGPDAIVSGTSFDIRETMTVGPNTTMQSLTNYIIESDVVNNTVPEPASAGLFGIGLSVVIAWRRRRATRS